MTKKNTASASASPRQIARLALIKAVAPKLNASLVAGLTPDQATGLRDMPAVGDFAALGSLS